MKKLLFVFSLITLTVISGCKKSPPEYIKEIKDYVEEKIVTITAESEIDDSETVVITPVRVVLTNPQLSAYSKLSDNQKKLYSIICTAVENMELRLIDVTEYSKSDIFSETISAHRALICDRPDFFWMPKTISVVSIEGKSKKYICFKDYDDKNNNIGFYGITPDQRSQMEERLNSVEKEISGEVNKYSTAFDKELFIHDYLCKNIVYDEESANNLKSANVNSTTVYGALVEGMAICEGYSKAMQYLCMKCGIPCSVIYGEYNGTAHMWNIINPGDGLYYLDVTFDDSSDSYVLHCFFNLTKQEMEKDHSFSEEFANTTPYNASDGFNFFDEDCNNTELNYFEFKVAYITDDCSDAVSFLLSEKTRGENYAELKNISNLSTEKALGTLKLKLTNAIDIENFYELESKNVIIVKW